MSFEVLYQIISQKHIIQFFTLLPRLLLSLLFGLFLLLLIILKHLFPLFQKVFAEADFRTKETVSLSLFQLIFAIETKIDVGLFAIDL